MTKIYSQEVKDFIAANIWGRSTYEMVEMTNEKFGTQFTIEKMRAFKKNNHLKSGVHGGCQKGRPTKRYPREVQEFVKQNYKGTGPKEMADKLNKLFGTSYTRAQIKGYYARNNLTCGNDMKFKKGQPSSRKGMKGICSPGSEKGWFKKGHQTVNKLPVGSETHRKGHYVYVKVAEPNVWRMKHRLVWEEAHGPVPEGKVLLFKDGDRRNTSLENLMLVERGTALTLTNKKMRFEDPDLTETAVMTIELMNAAKKRRRKEDEA